MPKHAFKPGKSGNPLGQAIVPREERLRRAAARREAKLLAEKLMREQITIEELARAHAPLALDALMKVLKNGSPDRVRVEAATALLDRAFGRPAERILNLNADVTPLTPEQSERAAAALERLRAMFAAGRSLLPAREPAPAPAVETAPPG